jgi:hypothetical protein
MAPLKNGLDSQIVSPRRHGEHRVLKRFRLNSSVLSVSLWFNYTFIQWTQ